MRGFHKQFSTNKFHKYMKFSNKFVGRIAAEPAGNTVKIHTRPVIFLTA